MVTENARRNLARPTLAMLPRVSDNLSFLYADIVKVVQTDTGVCAETETESESPAHAGMDRFSTH